MKALVLGLLAACGTTPDTRPETAAYVITAVLEPQCGRGGCHSSDVAAHGLVFDTIPNSLASFGTFGRDGGPVLVRGDAQASRLYTVTLDTERPMPPDSPLPDADIDLIKRWIDDGAAGYP